MEIDWVTIARMIAAAMVMLPTAGAALGIGIMGYGAMQGFHVIPSQVVICRLH